MSKKYSPFQLKETLSQFPPSQKIILAFSDKVSFEAFNKTFQKIKKEFPNARLLSLGYFLSLYLENKQESHDCIYGQAMAEEHGNLYNLSVQFAKKWRLDQDQNDFTLFEGLSLGFCIELCMHHFFQAVFTCATDLEIYLREKTPDTVIYFNHGNAPIDHEEGWVDFNIFENLLPFKCRQMGIDVLDVQAFPSTRKIACQSWKKFFQWSPPLPLFKGQIRLPSFLYSSMKFVFLILKNTVARARAGQNRINLLIASPTTYNYMGDKLIHRILEKGSLNLFVWNGESRNANVYCIFPRSTKKIRARDNHRLASKFKQKFISDRARLRNSTLFEEIPISEIYSEFFENIYTLWFPKLIDFARAFEKQLLDNNINCLISHSDHSIFERLAIILANHFQIPTINIQHGIDAPPSSTQVGYPSIASREFVWGNVDRNFKTSKGVSPGTIDIIGCHLHSFRNYQSEDKALRLDSPGTFLFICNSGGQFRCDNRMTFLDNEQQLKLVLECMKSFPNKTLVIKPRISDVQVGVYEKLVNDLKVDNAKIIQQPIADLIKECDLYFNVFSTAGLEAIVFNKPGIQFLFTYDNKAPMIENTGTEHIPFAKMGAALGLEKPDVEELTRLIRSVYESPEVREKMRLGRIKFLEEYANYGKGDPADLFLNALNKVLNENLQNSL